MNSQRRAGVLAATLALSMLLAPVAGARTLTGDEVWRTNSTNASEVCSENSLTIHLNNKSNQVGNVIRPGASVVLEGYKVRLAVLPKYSLNTAEDWEKAKEQPTLEEGKKDGQPVATKVTDAQGTAVFTGLQPGLYYLEVEPPSAEAAEYAPILLTLPIGQAASKSGPVRADGTPLDSDFWNCSPEVYLKTKPGEPTPGEPTPSEPTPSEPTPSEPTPGKPTPGVDTPGSETPDTDTPGGGSSSSGGGSSSSSRGGSLARTGASVIGIALLGAGAVSLGLLLTRRRREEA